MRRYFRNNPFQLDLFIKRIRLGVKHLLGLRSGMTFHCPVSGLEAVFRFARNGLFFFQTAVGLFPVTADQAAYLELQS